MDKRQAILQATAKLVSLHGLQNTPTSLIAKEAGVGEGTIYRYFKDKEELVVTVYTSLFEDFKSAVMTDFSEKDVIKECFFKCLRNLYDFYRNNQEKVFLLDYLSASPLLQPTVKTIVNEPNQQFQQLFMEGKAQKIIRDDIGIEVMISFIYGAVTTLAKKGLAITEDQLEIVLQMAWNSIRA